MARGRELPEKALGEFREIRSPMFIAETQVRLNESQVLEGDFATAFATSRELVASFRGRPGLEQVELTTLRLLGTASGFSVLAALRPALSSTNPTRHWTKQSNGQRSSRPFMNWHSPSRPGRSWTCRPIEPKGPGPRAGSSACGRPRACDGDLRRPRRDTSGHHVVDTGPRRPGLRTSSHGPEK